LAILDFLCPGTRTPFEIGVVMGGMVVSLVDGAPLAAGAAKLAGRRIRLQFRN
jgi:predicted MFS family arabinose efflux permease